jgi:Leucine-rich repeat (LRR) protein
MSLYSSGSSRSIASINCGQPGAGSPALGGIVDLAPFRSLQSFVCRSNAITECRNYEKISTLKYIDISSNSIATTIPSFSNLVNLSAYNCSNNFITDSLPDLSLAPALTSFDCSYNLITGSIPSLVGNVNLTNVDFTSNQFTGSPPDISNNSRLISFQANANLFTGTIPAFSPLNSNLQLYRVYGTVGSETGLTGSVPNLDALFSLNTFSVASNKLTGSAPGINFNPSLKYFFINDNLLTGNIPEIGVKPNLTWYWCYNNQLAGTIPSVSGCPSLQQFYCYGNSFTSFTNTAVGSALTDFQIYGNNFTGANGLNGAYYVLSAFYTRSVYNENPNVANGSKLAKIYMSGSNMPKLRTAAQGTINGLMFTYFNYLTAHNYNVVMGSLTIPG